MYKCTHSRRYINPITGRCRLCSKPRMSDDELNMLQNFLSQIGNPARPSYLYIDEVTGNLLNELFTECTDLNGYTESMQEQIELIKSCKCIGKLCIGYGVCSQTKDKKDR